MINLRATNPSNYFWADWVKGKLTDCNLAGFQDSRKKISYQFEILQKGKKNIINITKKLGACLAVEMKKQ